MVKYDKLSFHRQWGVFADAELDSCRFERGGCALDIVFELREREKGLEILSSSLLTTVSKVFTVGFYTF